jgi:hypothetical protein
MMQKHLIAPFLGGSIFSCPLGRFQTNTVANPYPDRPAHARTVPVGSAAAYSEIAMEFSFSFTAERWSEFSFTETSLLKA